MLAGVLKLGAALDTMVHHAPFVGDLVIAAMLHDCTRKRANLDRVEWLG